MLSFEEVVEKIKTIPVLPLQVLSPATIIIHPIRW